MGARHTLVLPPQYLSEVSKGNEYLWVDGKAWNKGGTRASMPGFCFKKFYGRCWNTDTDAVAGK